jgi:hypothetical protein
MTSVPGTTHRYLRQTPSERQVRTEASSSERISPHHRVRRPNFFAWVKPSNLKAECISVMLLCAFDITATGNSGTGWPIELIFSFAPTELFLMQQNRPRVKIGHYPVSILAYPVRVLWPASVFVCGS